MKRRLTSCLAVAATVFIVGLADAQETEQKKRDPSRSDQKKSIQLPAFLEDLNLSATQR